MSDLSTTQVEFRSWSDLRRGYLELLDEATSTQTGERPTIDQIRSFLHNASTAGRWLKEKSERLSAQRMLDYWSGELAGRPDLTADDMRLPRLVRADGDDVAGSQPPEPRSTTETLDSGRTSPAIEVLDHELGSYDSKAKDQIRLAATARLWKDTGKDGFLLVKDDVIKFANAYKDTDPNIKELVDASIAYRVRRIRQLIVATCVSAVCVAILAVMLYTTIFPAISRALQKEVVLWNKHQDGQGKYLRYIGWTQIFMSAGNPVTLSRSYLTKIEEEGIGIVAPNFVRSKLDHVYFDRAEMVGAIFAEARMDGVRFLRSNLSFDTFNDTSFKNTSFAASQLYRATFDRAQFLSSSLNGANLLLASFRDTDLDRWTMESLRNTAWWLAVGWTSRQVKRLNGLDQTGLSQSPLYLELRHNKEFGAVNSPPASWERVMAMNDLAWTQAQWGVDLGQISAQVEQAGDCSETPAWVGGGNPTASSALSNAMCTMHGLMKSEDFNAQSQHIETLLSNIGTVQSTLGYVMLQLSDVNDAAALKRAVEVLEQADVHQNRGRSEVAAPNTRFMLAFAKAAYARALQDTELERDSLTRLGTTLRQDRYTPSHELHNLRKYFVSADGSGEDSTLFTVIARAIDHDETLTADICSPGG
jgi:uncharacterized protein YjbI with pentapeptide repeats